MFPLRILYREYRMGGYFFEFFDMILRVLNDQFMYYMYYK